MPIHRGRRTSRSATFVVTGNSTTGASDLATLGRGMQWYVVKHALYAQSLHVLDERGSLVEVPQEEVIHVGVVTATVREDRATHATFALQGGKGLVVARPR